nr:hypothetical protein [Nocardioidaceae bacterium]
RTAYEIVVDLTTAGYVVKEKDGRRNRYTIQAHLPLPDSIGRRRTIGEVLDLLAGADEAGADGADDGSAEPPEDLRRRTAAQ